MAKRKRKRRTLTRKERIQRSDGALCVTFVNTGAGDRKALTDYADLLIWGIEHDALTRAEAERLERQARERPGPAAGVFRKARSLHARLRRILLALGAGEPPEDDDFAAFNAALRASFAARELLPTLGEYRWTWGDDDDELDRMLWPVLYSAASLLVSDQRDRVRPCQRPDCDMLFLARGSGRPRKWCGVVCRNRASAKTHYHEIVKPKRQRHRQAADAAQSARLAGYGEGSKPPAEPETE